MKRERTIALMDADKVPIGYHVECEPCAHRHLDLDSGEPVGEPCGGKRTTMIVGADKIRATEQVTKYRSQEVVIPRAVFVTTCERCDFSVEAVR